MDVTCFVVPGHLTADQATAIRRELLGGPILDPADMFTRLVKIVGSPVQRCADVETLCVSLPTLYDNLKDFGCAQVFPASMRSANGTDIELVRRTDMEAQVAARDAERRRRIAQVRYRIGGIEIDEMEGDNLAVTLCSAFEDPDDQAGENGWTERATDCYERIMDLIHTEYVAAMNTDNSNG